VKLPRADLISLLCLDRLKKPLLSLGSNIDFSCIYLLDMPTGEEILSKYETWIINSIRKLFINFGFVKARILG